MPQWSDDVVRRYLLRDLRGSDLHALEEQLIEDGSLQERVAAVESELVDDYVAGRLDPSSRSRFEACYLGHARGARQVEFARQLRAALAAPPARRRPRALLPRSRLFRVRARRAAIAASLTLLVGSSWWMWRGHEEHAQAAMSASGVVLLRPGATRGSGVMDRAVAPAAGRPLTLGLPMQGERASELRVEIWTPDGVVAWRNPAAVRTRDGTPIAEIALQPGQLLPGDYVVRLSARSAAGDWRVIGDYALRLTPAR